VHCNRSRLFKEITKPIQYQIFLPFPFSAGARSILDKYVSLGIFFSSLTNNQIIAFILSILVSFLFTISGFPLMINFITGILPIEIVELISSFSFLTHFSSIQTGFFSIKGLFFFLSFIALWNYLTIIKFLNRD